MNELSDGQPAPDTILAIAERASLYAVLLSALAHQRRPQPLPPALFDDLNAWPSQRPDFAPRGR